MRRVLVVALALLLLFQVSGASAQVAKGRIVVATSATAATWITEGTNGYVLTADSNEASGVKWAAPGAATLPSGMVFLIVSGTCPAGSTEEASLSGAFLLGTVAANSDIGGTGGANSVTPAGTVAAPTFTGTPFSSVINHTHAVNVTDPTHSHVTNRYPTATGGSSGFTIDTSMSGTPAANTLRTASASTGITASSDNPAGGVSSITPEGTNSAPTFTGTSGENRPAFVKVIFCKAN